MTAKAASFVEWMRRSFDLGVVELPAARRAEYETLVAALADDITSDGPRALRQLPAHVRTTFGGRGFAWNGIYRVRDRTLELVAAAGPPVCAALPLAGGVGSSGMCWDGVLMNQTLVAGDVRRWPGYVSCDSDSGLRTVAGLVCPIRNAAGRPIAVWDLDAVRPLATEDPGFFDRLLATLSAILAPDEAMLAPA